MANLEVKDIPNRADPLADGDKVLTVSSEGEVKLATLEQVKDLIPPGDASGVRTISASGTEQSDDDVVLVDSSAGDITLTLLPIASAEGRIKVKKISQDGNKVTIKGDGSELIDDANTAVLSNYNDVIEITHGTTKHYITGQYIR